MPPITFYSTIFNKESMKSNSEKILQITEMSSSDEQQIKSFLEW